MVLERKSLFRLAHISDLHFSKITWNPSQFFSKRWLGNMNLALTRKHHFNPAQLTSLIPSFHEQKIDSILITGDLTCTSQKKELALAKEFISLLQEEKFNVFTLPGNHDHYTKKAYRERRFYNYFPSTYTTDCTVNLEKEGITTLYLKEGWWLFALDTALSTSLLSSNGYFSAALEEQLTRALNSLPPGHQVILMNHFPLFSNESARKSLIRKDALQKILENNSQVKLFLHGHTHDNCVADLRSSQLPILLDSGSTSKKKGATWNLIDIGADGCEVGIFQNRSIKNAMVWEKIKKHDFVW